MYLRPPSVFCIRKKLCKFFLRSIMGFHQIAAHFRNPFYNSSGAISPCSTSFSRASHSAVSREILSLPKDCNQIRSFFCRDSCFFFLSTNPAETSFSKIAARVAGGSQPSPLCILRHICRPCRFHRRQKGILRIVFRRACLSFLILASTGSNNCPFNSSGRVVSSFSFSSVFCLRLFRKRRSVSFQPSLSTLFPFAVNVCPAQPISTLTAS